MTQQQTMTKTLHPLDVPARLDEFKSMKDGWLEGEGIAPSHNGLDWLSSKFTQFFSNESNLPYIYPTPEGNVEAEWGIGTQSVILEIDIENHTGHWLQCDDATDEESERNLKLDDDADWAWSVSAIRRMTETAK